MKTYRVYINDEFEIEAPDIYRAQALALEQLESSGDSPVLPPEVRHVAHSVSANCFMPEDVIRSSRLRRRHRGGRNPGQHNDPEPEGGERLQ